jgi:hypothetical protein
MQTEHDILLVGAAFAQPYGYGLTLPTRRTPLAGQRLLPADGKAM